MSVDPPVYDTRARVEAAIEKLGYRPNSVARALKSRRSATIGMVLAGEELYELPRILQGVQSAAQRSGYWGNLASWQGGTTRDLTETLRRLTDQAVALSRTGEVAGGQGAGTGMTPPGNVMFLDA